MKKLSKSLLSIVSVLTLMGNSVALQTPAKAEITAVQLCELDLEQLDIGTRDIPGGVLPDGSQSAMFEVVEEDTSISPSGKALLGIGDGPEIYFDTSEPVTATGVEEDTDYFITAKIRTHTTSSSDMQYKVAFLAQGNHSQRVAFRGVQGNSLLFGDKAIEGDRWYNYFIRLHIGKNGGETYLAEKIYPVGESEPKEWDVYANADAISNYYDIYTAVDCIGVKGWLQNGCGLAELSVYKYESNAVEEYDAVRADIDNIGELSAGMSIDEINTLINDLQTRIDAFPGNAHKLLSEAMDPIYSEIEAINAAESEFMTLSGSEITSDNIFELYNRAESIKESVENSLLTGIRDSLCARIDEWVRLNLEPAYEVFTAVDEMLYTSSDTMNSGTGWTGSWETEGTFSQNDGLMLNGTLRRNFSTPVNAAFDCEYVFELKDVLAAGSGFTVECGGVSFGARYDNGAFYPIAGDSKGTAALSDGKKYSYIFRVNTGTSSAELRVYNSENEKSETPEITVPVELTDTDTISISADGTAFGQISKEVYPVGYAESLEKELFDAIAEKPVTEDEIAAKEELLKKLSQEVNATRSGAVMDYLRALLSEAEDGVLSARLDNIIGELKNNTTAEGVKTAVDMAERISNAALREEYMEQLKGFEDYVANTVPVIESVGIEGEVKAGNTVRARISINDTIGNGNGYRAEWLLNSGVAGTGDVYTIPADAGAKKLSLRVTAINVSGVEGQPVTTEQIRIAGASQGSGISVGGGGGGGSVNYSPVVSGSQGENAAESESDEQDNDEAVSDGVSQAVKTFSDIENHWAKQDILSLAQRGVVNGVDNEHFMPDGSVTRAEFVKMLTAALCIDAVEYNDCFSDVSSDDWFAGYAAAAAAEGIVSGDDETNFMPQSLVTREQAAIMLVRAYKRYYTVVTSGDIDKFSDVDMVSEWAYDELRAAVGVGLISGKSETELAPQSETTRAEAAVMINRLVNSIVKIK